MKGRWSLQHRLVTRVAGVYACVVLLTWVVAFLVLWLGNIARDPDGSYPAFFIAEAVAYQSDRTLTIDRTNDLQRIKAADPSFWAVVRDRYGNEATVGTPPQNARDLIDRSGVAGGVERATLWLDGSAEQGTIALWRKESKAGPVLIGVKLGRTYTFREVVLFIAVSWLVFALPVAGIPAVLAVPLVRLIIRRTLHPLDVVADQAASIDSNQRSSRLSDEDVPREALPLVEAVNAALGRLEQGYEQQAMFLADAAHELRTPIAILQTRLDGAPDDALSNGLRRDGRRLASLANQLLAFQQLEFARLDQDVVDLSALARNLTADFAPLVLENGGTISFEGEEGVRIIGDQLALERALGNLVQNAVDHGGPNIVVHVRNSSICVSDDGSGVPPEAQHAIFQPFHRLKPRQSGAGLGLALVRQIVRRLGGSVTVDSGLGRGFAITIRLPPAPAA